MYTWMNNIIKELYITYNTNNVYELYDALNITIRRTEPNSILLNGNDSLYIRNYIGMEVVFIRNDLTSQGERFVLLHELGHAVLHKDIQTAAFNRNFININKLEKQANYFAFKMMNIHLDEIELKGMCLEQIAHYAEIPYEQLSQIINL